jgi:hypothetical protein
LGLVELRRSLAVPIDLSECRRHNSPGYRHSREAGNPEPPSLRHARPWRAGCGAPSEEPIARKAQRKDRSSAAERSPQAWASLPCNGSNPRLTHGSRIIAECLDIFGETFGDKIYQIGRHQIIVFPIFRTISFVSVRKRRSGDTKPRGEGREIGREGLESQKHIQSPEASVYF